jgi:multiple sugar transport system permease protein
MVMTSLQPKQADALDLQRLIRPDALHWENYRDVFQNTGCAIAMLNSIVVTTTVTVALVAISSLAAFAFARLNFTGRDKIFIGYLATMMIPSAVTIIPSFLVLRSLGWLNSYAALIIPPLFSAYGVFLLRQFFLSIPRELEEAATLDGCSPWGVYWRIVLPLSKPALIALAILTFVSNWRSFLWPLIVTHTSDKFTLPLALGQFQEMYGIQWPLLMAGSVVLTIPMLLVFLFGQRFFIEGTYLGAVKG